MINKAIHDIKIEDFIGKWASFDGVIKLFVNYKGYLAIGDKTYEGKLTVEYVPDNHDCVNCLKLTIGENSFFIKQISHDGFYLSFDASETFLLKIH